MSETNNSDLKIVKPIKNYHKRRSSLQLPRNFDVFSFGDLRKNDSKEDPETIEKRKKEAEKKKKKLQSLKEATSKGAEAKRLEKLEKFVESKKFYDEAVIHINIALEIETVEKKINVYKKLVTKFENSSKRVEQKLNSLNLKGEESGKDSEGEGGKKIDLEKQKLLEEEKEKQRKKKKLIVSATSKGRNAKKLEKEEKWNETRENYRDAVSDLKNALSLEKVEKKQKVYKKLIEKFQSSVDRITGMLKKFIVSATRKGRSAKKSEKLEQWGEARESYLSAISDLTFALSLETVEKKKKIYGKLVEKFKDSSKRILGMKKGFISSATKQGKKARQMEKEGELGEAMDLYQNAIDDLNHALSLEVVEKKKKIYEKLVQKFTKSIGRIEELVKKLELEEKEKENEKIDEIKTKDTSNMESEEPVKEEEKVTLKEEVTEPSKEPLKEEENINLKEEIKEQKKEEVKEEVEKEIKEQPKEEAKEEVKEPPKEETKEHTKEEVVEKKEPERVKEDSKVEVQVVKEVKEEVIEPSKEDLQEPKKEVIPPSEEKVIEKEEEPEKEREIAEPIKESPPAPIPKKKLPVPKGKKIPKSPRPIPKKGTRPPKLSISPKPPKLNKKSPKKEAKLVVELTKSEVEKPEEEVEKPVDEVEKPEEELKSEEEVVEKQEEEESLVEEKKEDENDLEEMQALIDEIPVTEIMKPKKNRVGWALSRFRRKKPQPQPNPKPKLNKEVEISKEFEDVEALIEVKENNDVEINKENHEKFEKKVISMDDDDHEELIEEVISMDETPSEKKLKKRFISMDLDLSNLQDLITKEEEEVDKPKKRIISMDLDFDVSNRKKRAPSKPSKVRKNKLPPMVKKRTPRLPPSVARNKRLNNLPKVNRPVIRKRRNSLRFEQLQRTFSTKKKEKKEEPKISKEKLEKVETQKDKLLEEFVATEQDYVNQLQVIQTHFINELEKKKIVSKKVIGEVFNSLKMMIPINTMFLMRLKKCGVDNREQFFSIVNEFSSCFKLYGSYVNSYKSILDVLRKERKSNKKFIKFLKKKKDEFVKKGIRIHTLQSYLIIPIQRLPRYKLLFKGILMQSKKIKNKTPKQKEEMKGLRKSFRALSRIAEFIDKGQEASDYLNEVEMMEQYVKINDFVKPYRKILMVQKFIHFKNEAVGDSFKEWEECHCYLFSDMLMCIGFNRKKKKKKKIVLLKTYVNWLKSLRISRKVKEKRHIIETKSSDDHLFRIQIAFNNSGDRDKFFMELRRQMSECAVNPQFVIKGPVDRKVGKGLFGKKAHLKWEAHEMIPPMLLKVRDMKAVLEYSREKKKRKKMKESLRLGEKFWKIDEK